MIITLLKKCSDTFLKINSKSAVALLSFFVFFGITTANAQVNTYVVDQLQYGAATTPASFALLPSPAVATVSTTNKTNLSAITGNDDDTVYSVALPFNFSYGGGLPYLAGTLIRVSTNGFITFGSTAPTTGNYNPISSTEGYAGAISAYGRDLDLTAASSAVNISYFTSGLVGNRIFKIEWVVKRSTGITTASLAGPGDTSNMVFQVWLYENPNVIEMHYNIATFSSTATLTGQVGLRGANNLDFKNLSYTTANASWPAAPTTMVESTSINTNSVVTKGSAPATNACIVAASNRIFRFTPVTCFAPSGLNVPLASITSSSATLNWNAASPNPLNGYDYYVTTSATAPIATTTPTGSVGFGVTTASLTSLVSGATQYVYVRSRCSGSDTSGWSTVYNFNTPCPAVAVPYFQFMDDPGAPTTPTCTLITNENTVPANSLNRWNASPATTESINADFLDDHLVYNSALGTASTVQANTWFYTQGITLTAGITYTIGYDYGGTNVPSTATNKMEVYYGTLQSPTAMTNFIDNHPNIRNALITNYVSFTPPTSGTYYFGFHAYSAPNQGRLFLDTIQVLPGGCVQPTGLAASNVTGTSALLNWTAPTPAPAGGYAYFLTTTNPLKTAGAFTVGKRYQITTVGTTDYTVIGATSNTVGNYFIATGVGAGTGTATEQLENNQIATGFTAAGNNLLSLTGLTGSTTYYVWVRGVCGGGNNSQWSQSTSFTTLFVPAYCIPSNGATTSYFSNFTTTGAIANINNSSGFSAGGYGNFTSLFVTQSPGSSINFSTGIVGATVGIAIWVDWDNNGTFTTAERMFNTAAYVANASGTFTVPGGQALGDYRMRIVCDFLATNPNQCTFTGAGEAEDYTFRVVTPPPALTISSSSSIQCANDNSPLVTITSPLANYNTYSWSPAVGVSGNATTGYTFNSNSTITYTLTGTQTVAPFSTRSITYTYTANQKPTPITITPASASVCAAGPAQLLTAAGGIVSGITVLGENFNAGAAGWTTVNASTGGATAAAAWTLRPSGYNPGGASGITSVVSNDASQFYISNSDAQGSGSQTDVTLTSPVFSLVGYTSASLSFYHYYKAWINGSARVEISTNGSTWTLLQTWGTTGPPNETQGTPTAFVNPIYNLNSYVGQATIQVRFKYFASWGYVWALDNFLVSGSTGTSITWSPTAGLFTDATASTPYTGTATNTVYALPTATTTYSASASTPSPVCTTTTPVVITVAPIVVGTASSDQIICGGTPASLTVTGFSGTVSGWQYSNNLAFTAPVSIPASASSTLASAQMGALSANRYYRAVITNGLCTAYSNIVSIVVGSTTWDGSTWSNGIPNNSVQAIFEDVYDAASDPSLVGTILNACSILVTGNGNVTVNSNYTFHVVNGVEVESGGTVVFQNNSSLVQVNNVANIGNITYIRNSAPMRLFDYTYWSSPVSPFTLVGLSPYTMSDKYFIFNPIINNWQNVAANSLMDKGRGYAVRSPQNFTSTPTVYTAVFQGVPNNGDISLPFTLGAGAVVLIGNPYPSALDGDLFMLANSPSISGGNPAGNLDPNMYFWTHNTPITANNYIASDYAIYNFAGGVGTAPSLGPINSSIPTGKVAAGQGFFMKALSSGAANYTNAMRIDGQNNQFYKNGNSQNVSGSIEKHRVWLEMFNNEGAFKQTMIGYIENATNGFDLGFDGELFEGGNVISIYSTLDNTRLGIQSRALPFSESDIVPLGYKATNAGNYEIKLSNFDGLFEEQHVYLEDYLLNVIHDLKLSNYSFTTNSGTFENRFALRFTANALSIGTSVFNEESVIVIKNNQNINIKSSHTPLESVTVFDIRGRELFTSTGIDANEFVISNLAAAQQVLILKIKSVDGKVVDKKIVF